VPSTGAALLLAITVQLQITTVSRSKLLSKTALADGSVTSAKRCCFCCCYIVKTCLQDICRARKDLISQGYTFDREQTGLSNDG
jgi:hypothetical protein